MANMPPTLGPDGAELLPILEPVCGYLEAWRSELQTPCSNVADEANRLGLISRIESAVGLLRWLDAHEIVDVPVTHVIPEVWDRNCYAEVRIVNDRESDRPEAWVELPLTDGKIIRPSPGSLLIEAVRHGWD